MRFLIQDGKPYLVSGGRAYPVEITEDRSVKIDHDGGRMEDAVGRYTLDEVIAKIGFTKKKRAKRSQKEG